MNAGVFAERYKDRAVGMRVLTAPYGDWPGGPAIVTRMAPDPGAPEIVFDVRSETHPSPDEPGELWEIGVFDHEEIEVIKGT